MRSKESLKLSLKKWQLREKTPKHRFYFLYSMFILAFAYIIDELATNFNNILQNEVIDTFIEGSTENEKLAFYTIILTAISAVSIFSFLYKPLADKFGRKPFLAINTVGMGVAMFICFSAQSLVIYGIGLVFLYFFIPCDIQVVYILETASDKHRSFWLAFFKAIAVVSIAIVSPLRSWAITLGHWQLAFLIPAIIGVAAGVVMFLFMKETDPFIENKIKFLKKEIRNYDKPKEKVKKNAKDAQGGIISAIKYMFINKHLLWLFLVGVIFAICAVGINNYSQIMSNSNIGEQKMSLILFLYPFFTALVEIVAGILSDKIGRKKANIFTGFVTLIGFLYFVVGIKSNWYSGVSGICLGLFMGGYLSSVDIFNVMSAEQSPTNLRSSLLSVINVSLSAGSFLGTGVLIIMTTVNPYLDLGFFGIVIIIPTLFAGLLILMSKIPETKQISLQDVGEKIDSKKEDDEDEIKEVEHRFK